MKKLQLIKSILELEKREVVTKEESYDLIKKISESRKYGKKKEKKPREEFYFRKENLVGKLEKLPKKITSKTIQDTLDVSDATTYNMLADGRRRGWLEFVGKKGRRKLYLNKKGTEKTKKKKMSAKEKKEYIRENKEKQNTETIAEKTGLKESTVQIYIGEMEDDEKTEQEGMTKDKERAIEVWYPSGLEVEAIASKIGVKAEQVKDYVESKNLTRPVG